MIPSAQVGPQEVPVTHYSEFWEETVTRNERERENSRMKGPAHKNISMNLGVQEQQGFLS